MIKIANISKQFEAWVINFKTKPFLRARLKLTAYYTSGVFIILFVFSLAVYGLFIKNINSNLEYEGVDEGSQANIELQIIDKASDELQTILVVVDFIIILFIAFLSYYLAGKTLYPVEQAYMQQRKFVADAAHELRTPLAVMKTGAETVLGGKNSKEEYKKLVIDSLEEVNFLSSMVDDLLFLAKSDNLQKVEFFKINLSKLANKQIDLMQIYAQKKNVVLKNKIVDDLYIEGDRAYLKRLLTNLIKNAIDYNKDKGEVKVSLQKEDNKVKLKIKDTGIGIKKEELSHIFGRFYKADQARVKQLNGAGLGLSIVKEIVELHQGKINIKSEFNKGTSVTIYFNFV